MSGSTTSRRVRFAAFWTLSVLVIALGGVLGAAVPVALSMTVTWALGGALIGGALAVAACARMLSRTVAIKGPEALLASGFAGLVALVLDVVLAFVMSGGGG
jgi:hypothetical protein